MVRSMGMKAAWGSILAVVLVGGCGHPPSTGVDAAAVAFKALDANHDGKLTLQESGLSALAFQALDANGDGVLDLLEWEAAPDPTQTVDQLQQQTVDTHTTRDPHGTGSTMRGD